MFRWPTVTEKLVMLTFAANSTGAGAGVIAWWLCDWHPIMFGIGWGMFMAGIVGVFLFIKAWQMSGDEIERIKLYQEYDRFKRLEDTQPMTIYQSTTTALVGRIQLDQRRYIRDRLQAGIRLSARNYPRVDKATWDELHRMGLIQYVNGKPNAGVELTPAGYQWARVSKN